MKPDPLQTAHALRTPLTTLLLQIQTLRRWAHDDSRELSDEDLREKLRVSEKQARRLVEAIDELEGSLGLHAPQNVTPHAP